MKFDTIFETFIKADLESGLSPMLMGEPGIGKSSIIKALETTMRTKVFQLTCNQLADRADLTGARLLPCGKDKNGQDTYKQVFFPHATIMDCIKYAQDHPHEYPILFMDEINRTSADITSAILSFTTDRKIGSIEFPSNVRFILAGNDKGNVTALDEASISRFSVYHCLPDTATYLNVNPDLNPFIKETLTKHPECILCKQSIALTEDTTKDDDDDESIEDILEVDTDFTQFTTPRTLTYLSNWLNQFSNQELMSLLPDDVLKEGIEAHVGDTIFTTYLMETITSNIMTTNNQTNTVTAVKPKSYDALKSAPDMTSLENMIDTMDDNEKSGCLIYALFEKADNTVVINALANHITTINPNDMRTLTTLTMSGKLDSANVNVLMQNNSTISQNLNVILEMAN